MIRIIILVLFFMVPQRIFSQDSLLTLQQAIEIALKNNFDIRLIKNASERRENDNTIGNAGMLPDIDLNGSYLRSSNSLKQKYNNGQEINSDASLSTSAVGDIGATWTIFDGLKMFNTKNKLSELSLLSRDQLKITLENTLEELIASYYFIVRQEQLLKAIQEELTLSEERVKIADRKMKNGSGSRLGWLQAKTEFNRQKTIKITLETQSSLAFINLNHLLGRNIETSFSIDDSVIITYKPSYNDLKKSVIEQNNVLSYYKRNQTIANLGLKETKSLRWPVISLNADYVYSKNTNENGFSLLNQSQGFNYGFKATLPLFYGFNINRQIKNSKLDVIYSDISLESANMQVNAELFDAWTVFTNNFKLLQIEEENILFASEVLLIANERYRVGVSNSTEQLEAQRTFEEAMKRLADARYNAKISETRLRKLNGELVR